jgi:2-oxo-3-hexenedioate decarboxylase
MTAGQYLTQGQISPTVTRWNLRVPAEGIVGKAVGLMSGDWTIKEAAEVLLAAEADRVDRSALTDAWSDLDLPTAYQVQDELISQKVEGGESIVGIKLGLTSRAKQVQMGVSSPITAWVTDRMVLPTGGPLDTGELIHPRVEPELVFVLGEQLSGPGVTAARAMKAVSHVYGGLEVIDSRFTDFRFQLPDVVADNASSARFVIGTRGRRPEELDLTLEACVLKVNGDVVDTATGTAVLGHPGEALALAANALAQRQIVLEAGWLVLTGGMTDAVPALAGDIISIDFTHLASINLRCT